MRKLSAFQVVDEPSGFHCPHCEKHIRAKTSVTIAISHWPWAGLKSEGIHFIVAEDKQE